MILRLVQVAWSCILNILMGGVVYGFASLTYMLMSSEDKGGCSLESKYANLCFTVAVSFSCISPLFTSAILEGLGRDLRPYPVRSYSALGVSSLG